MNSVLILHFGWCSQNIFSKINEAVENDPDFEGLDILEIIVTFEEGSVNIQSEVTTAPSENA